MTILTEAEVIFEDDWIDEVEEELRYTRQNTPPSFSREEFIKYLASTQRKGEGHGYAVGDKWFLSSEDFIDKLIDCLNFKSLSRKFEGISLEPGTSLLGGYRSQKLMDLMQMKRDDIAEKPFIIRNSDLLYFNADQAILPGLILEDVNAYCARFCNGADVTRGDWVRVYGRDLDLSGGIANHLAIRESHMPSSRWIGTEIYRTKYYRTNLSHAKMTGAKPYRTVMNKVELIKTKLTDVDTTQLDLIDSSLDDAVGVAEKERDSFLERHGHDMYREEIFNVAKMKRGKELRRMADIGTGAFMSPSRRKGRV